MAAANVPERIELFAGGLAVALLIVFLGALRATLRRAEGEAGALSATAVIAGSVLGAGILVAIATDDRDLRPLLAFPAGTLLVAAGAGILSTGALPRPIGLAALAAAVLQAPAAMALDDDAIMAGLAFVAWAALASAAMARRS